ncbi:MAG: hypothetical protein M3373_14645 [Gemmatimonadota bacterium]|nr:hypothetical protein [Gemmatimonadota bacterium]
MNPFLNTAARTIAVFLIAAATVTGCQPNKDQPASADSASGMAGMGGMGGMMGTGMMDSMPMHMKMMDTMRADRMQEMLPMHRQMAANMLSQMNSEMRSMNMAADAKWSATVDSIRQDLIRMPDMGAQELKAMMPAHHARMTRLMQMHRDMMERMKS